MTKFLTLRNALLASVGGALLLGSVAAAPAFADDGGARGGDREITLEQMLEKTGESFDKLDTDSNGVVTQEEADAAKGDRQAKMQERTAEMFDRMDADGDGIVQEGDRGYGRLADRLDLEGPLTLEQIQAGMAAKAEQRSADRTTEMGDDARSFPQTRDEALAAATAKFQERDANGDGVLSGDELPKKKGRGGNGGGKKGGERGERD